MLVSSRLKIKTKWGYVPILGQFVDFNSFYCPHLPTFLTQMRKIFILSWPEFQKNVPATEDFRQFSEDFLKKCPETFKRPLNTSEAIWCFSDGFELIVKKTKEVIKIYEMKFIS